MENSQGDALNQLRQAVIAQKTVNLEDSPSRPELSDLHDRFRAYDSFVSQLVITVLQGGRHEVDYLERESIERELDRLQNHSDPMVVREARKYAQYKQRLDRMRDLAQQVIAKRRDQA